MKFHDFPWPGQTFYHFPGLESKWTNSTTFQVFKDQYGPLQAAKVHAKQWNNKSSNKTSRKIKHLYIQCEAHRHEHQCNKYTFLYSTVFTLLDRSKRFTLHTLADQFILAPTRLLWEEFSHAAITVNRLFTDTFPPLPFTQLSELGCCEKNENAGASKKQQNGLNPGLSRLVVRHSNAEVQSS